MTLNVAREITPAVSHGVPARAASAQVGVALSAPPHPDGRELRALQGRAEWIELRADLIGDLNPAWIRRYFSGRILYSLRSAAGGGVYSGPADRRRDRLVAAARHYDLVDLEARHDLDPDLLRVIPEDRRRISWHSQPQDLAGLRRTFADISGVGAALYLLAPRASRLLEALPPLLLLKELDRPDVTAYATGPAGTWSRILAPWFGAPIVYGRTTESANGIPTVEQLFWDYGFPALPPLRRLYGIVGGPALSGSLSPRLHNAAFRALGMPALYLPFRTDSLPEFWDWMSQGGLSGLDLDFGGVTVAAPHKEDALRSVSPVSELAERSGSASVLHRAAGRWVGDTTNAAGVVETLRRARVALAGRVTAVVGCGGAGRAAAAGLSSAGAHVTLVDSDADLAARSGALLDLPHVPSGQFQPEGFSLLVNATPLAGEAPFPVDRVDPGATVLDLVYRPEPTALVTALRAAGVNVIDGWNVVLVEVEHQFHLLTGRQLPVGQTRALLWAARAAQKRTTPFIGEVTT